MVIKTLILFSLLGCAHSTWECESKSYSHYNLFMSKQEVKKELEDLSGEKCKIESWGVK